MAHSERLTQLVKTSLAMAWLVGVGATALIIITIINCELPKIDI